MSLLDQAREAPTTWLGNETTPASVTLPVEVRDALIELADATDAYFAAEVITPELLLRVEAALERLRR